MSQVFVKEEEEEEGYMCTFLIVILHIYKS
jgi:hypothetical protein